MITLSLLATGITILGGLIPALAITAYAKKRGTTSLRCAVIFGYSFVTAQFLVRQDRRSLEEKLGMVTEAPRSLEETRGMVTEAPRSLEAEAKSPFRFDAPIEKTALGIANGTVILAPFLALLGGFLNVRYKVMRARRTQTRKPPAKARFVIYLLLPGEAGEALLGDLDEQYNEIRRDRTLGPRYAAFWYWLQVIISIRPLLWERVKILIKAVAAAYGLKTLEDVIRKFIALSR